MLRIDFELLFSDSIPVPANVVFMLALYSDSMSLTVEFGMEYFGDSRIGGANILILMSTSFIEVDCIFDDSFTLNEEHKRRPDCLNIL